MYEEYFKLSGQPFKLNPDPKFFFGSRSHNKAMAYLHYGLRQAEGFIVITGEIGAGKSMLISHLLDQLDRSRIAAAHLLTPNLRPEDLLSHILSAFRVEAAGDGKTANLEAFEDFLFDQLNHGRRVLLIVDEAQNLPVETLEELRILSNMDYDGTPLFQVFLVGQPDFRPILAGPNMEQLRQRIIASYHLEPLSGDETKNYIEHRMTVVGWKDDPVFTENAFSSIHEEAAGVPRKINKLCNRILLFCSLEEVHEVDREVVSSVAADLAEENVVAPPPVVAPAATTGAIQQKPRKKQKPGKSAPETGAKKAVEPSAASQGVNGSAPPKKQSGASPVVVPFEAVRKVSAEEAAKEKIAVAKPEKATAKTERKVNTKEGAMETKEKTREKKPVTEKKAVPVDEGEMSVLDRLRVQRAVKKENTDDAPKPATIHDVANAIAAASATGGAANAKAGDSTVGEFDSDEVEGEIDAPVFHEDVKGWRQTVVRSINETRDELKNAHSNMTRMRRQLNDAERRRRDKKAKITASLSRAQTLLSEIRDN